MAKNHSNLFHNTHIKPPTETDELFEDDYVDRMEEKDQQLLKKKLFGEIKSAIRKHEEKVERKKKIHRATKTAAAVLLLLSLNIGLWQALTLKEKNYQTGANEILKIELPDGSTACLNSNSSLAYSYRWAFGFERKVELRGEAYFDIAKDPDSRRFLINEGEVMEVEVFGTEFNFKNQHPIHKLTLLQGSVKLGYEGEGGNTTLMVTPGETVKLDVENQKIASKKTDNPSKLIAWQKRKLQMHNESLEEVLNIVTELYDLELPDQKIPLTAELISGSLPLSDNPNEVIENIQVLFDTKISLKQNTIQLP
ncbi:FecR domain-containing protein [Algoriphagus sp. AGSA1]|uniref:FecR family protein n=1 Tax=Algoriphagus sp. AGSA1 TaxID=2907213 RepID=UPI001F23F1D4|nr:FecR domain-containing protein [Algoriphagus sp. AGSA1]MCE7055866.1 FecR domain-containing protein [Algoriphagus sp. AGSA1]